LSRRKQESISSKWWRKWVQLQLQAWGNKRRIYTTKLPGKHSTQLGKHTVLYEDWFFQITEDVTEHNMDAVSQGLIIASHTDTLRYEILKILKFKCPVVNFSSPSFNIQNPIFFPQSVFLCVVRTSYQTAAISQCNIKKLAFITSTLCIYCTVKNGHLNVIQVSFHL
jgi:hypothetical protein